MNVIELSRTGYVFPRLALILILGAFLLYLGFVGARVFSRGRYDAVVKAGYLLAVVLDLFGMAYGALTI